MPPRTAPQITLAAIFIEILWDDSFALPNECLHVQLSCLYLSWLRVTLILNIDNPCYLLPTHPGINGNDTVIPSHAQIYPLIHHQHTPPSYLCPKLFSISYTVCLMADGYTSPCSRWLLQPQYFRLSFDPRL